LNRGAHGLGTLPPEGSVVRCSTVRLPRYWTRQAMYGSVQTTVGQKFCGATVLAGLAGARWMPISLRRIMAGATRIVAGRSAISRAYRGDIFARG